MSQTLRARPIALPTGRAGRITALALLALLLVVFWEAAGAPLVTLYHQRAERLDGDRDRLARMEALAARLPALRRQLSGTADRAAGPAALIDGATDAIASAALQGQVQAMASSLGATLSSSETVSGNAARDDAAAGGEAGRRDAAATARAGGFRRIGVRISVTAPFEVMAKLLQRIEANSPVLLVDDLQLHGSRIQLGSNPPLEGSLTVLAFRRADGRNGQAADAGEGDAQNGTTDAATDATGDGGADGGTTP